MGSHICCHTYGNTAGTITYHEWECSWKDHRLSKGFIVVRHEVYSLLTDVGHHLLADLGHLGLCVSHGCRWVTIDGAEVSLREYNRIAEGEVLGQPYKSIVDRCVSMWMVLTKYITHDSCTLLVCRIVSDTHVPHGVEDSSMYWLETIPCIRKGSGHDYAHGVVNVAALHLVGQIIGQYCTWPCLLG